MAFILRFPFRPQNTITGIDDTLYYDVGPLKVRLRDVRRYVVLEVRGFESADIAENFVPVVWAALRWVLIERGLNATYEVSVQQPTLASDPDIAAENLANNLGLPNIGPVHGLGNEGWPTVYEENTTIRFLGLGEATATVMTPADLYLSPLRDALGWQTAGSLFNDSRFHLASDLFSAYYFEHSPSARLVTLGMVLEVLAKPEGRHAEVARLLDKWAVELEQRTAEIWDDEAAREALESLKRELGFRREDASIRSRIQATARQLGLFYGPEESVRLARNARDVYDARSILVHSGKLPEPQLSSAVHTGSETVRLLLRAYYKLACPS